jgi:hypothetical protein
MVGNRSPAWPEIQVVESPAVLGLTVGDLLEAGGRQPTPAVTVDPIEGGRPDVAEVLARQTAEELESATDTVDIPADDIQATTDRLQEQIRDRQHLVYVLARRLR